MEYFVIKQLVSCFQLKNNFYVEALAFFLLKDERSNGEQISTQVGF